MRTAGGVAETTTFPLPNSGGAYKPLIQPETVFPKESWLEIPEREDHQEGEPY